MLDPFENDFWIGGIGQMFRDFTYRQLKHGRVAGRMMERRQIPVRGATIASSSRAARRRPSSSRAMLPAPSLRTVTHTSMALIPS
jgi:hypothetical protein